MLGSSLPGTSHFIYARRYLAFFFSSYNYLGFVVCRRRLHALPCIAWELVTRDPSGDNATHCRESLLSDIQLTRSNLEAAKIALSS